MLGTTLILSYERMSRSPKFLTILAEKKGKLTMRDEKEISKGKEEDECRERRWEEKEKGRRKEIELSILWPNDQVFF